MTGDRQPCRLLGRASLLVLLLAPSAFAQQGTVFPPSIAITNYDRVLIGEQEALESGAYVARVGSTTSGWYNPAGMILLEKTEIGGSATGYESDLIKLQGLSQPAGGGISISQLPSFFGAVFGDDVLHSRVWRLGISVTKPASWSQGIEAGGAAGPTTSYSSTVSFSTILPMLSVAFAPLPCLRFGVGVGVALTELSEVQTLSSQVVTATTANAFLRTLDGSGSIWNLTGNLGTQYDITQNLVVGAVLRFPGLKILSSGGLTYQDVNNNGTPWSQVFFKDRSATFDYKLPTEVDVGLGWHSSLFGLEADLRYHTAISDYVLLGSQNLVQTTTTAPNGTPVVTTSPFPGIKNGANQVFNWAIGGSVNITEWWSVHAGFFSDYSPTDTAGQTLFRNVSMYGVTAGAKVRGEHLSGSFGVGFNWGNSPNFSFPNSTTGTTITTKLVVRSLQLLYALTYKF
ncbi:MAG: OmpP1/FadL family transporter [Myxococcaceae bacterium]